MYIIYFDDVFYNKHGKKIYFYDLTEVDCAVDGEICWFHCRYGRMKLYRLHQVDNRNFVAEDLHLMCRTDDERWPEFQANPSLALSSNRRVD